MARFASIASIVVVVALALNVFLSGAASADPGTPGGLALADPSVPVNQPAVVPAPAIATPAAALESRRLREAGIQPKVAGCGGDCQYWFTLTWSAGDSRISDYTSWDWYHINSRDDLFFIEAAGSAVTQPGYILTNFEPWVKANTSVAQLGDRNPLGQVPAADGQPITVSLSYNGASISTTFYAAASTYNPYSFSNMYSSEWQGWKNAGITVANRWESRWFGSTPWGMAVANCGRGSIWWGNCSNR
jgi:hypothetical protein